MIKKRKFSVDLRAKDGWDEGWFVAGSYEVVKRGSKEYLVLSGTL
jgi:hypothetical protein